MGKGEVRAAFPECSALAAEFREAFGSGVRLKYASECGREIGRPVEQSPETEVTARMMSFLWGRAASGDC